MLHEEARRIIKTILGDNINFEGHFDLVFDSLKDNKQRQLVEWVKECKEGKHIALSSDKIRGLSGFILRFRDTNLRAILTKKRMNILLLCFWTNTNIMRMKEAN